MLSISKILKRSWHILWNYRTLWIFGFILALAAGGGGNGGSSRYTANDRQNNQSSGIQTQKNWQGLQGNTPREKLDDAFRQAGAEIQKLREQHPVEFRMGIALAITLFVVILLLGILTTILSYPAETASIRMVDEYEQTGVKVGFRQGWKYGWSRQAWRLFLVDFLINLPMLVLFVVLGLLGLWVFSAVMSGVETTIVSSVIASIGLAFLFILVTAVAMIILRVLRDFAWRTIVLESAGVMDSLRAAAGLVKRQWKNVGLMWLVMVGIQIAWAIVFIILVIPLLVVSILTAVGGVLAMIIPSLLTAGVASLLSVPDYWPWAFAAIVGLPFFAVVTFSPILLVSGWGLIYKSSVWTLTYRELKTLEAVAPATTA
jgi:hypothetical protein